jgi:DNA helicase IV
VRQDGRPPRVVPAGTLDGLAAAVLRITAEEVEALGTGNVAVISPASLVEPLAEAFAAAGVEHGVATHSGLANQITIVPVGMVKGLELDATVVVEPATILAEEPQPMRSLYVALTRATKLLTIVHAQPLPPVLHPDPLASSA